MTKVDTVRITWPNGLVQNETNQPVNKVDAIEETRAWPAPAR